MDDRIFYSYNSWKVGTFSLPPNIVDRDTQPKALDLLNEREIIALIGLRQTGKSTLALQLIDQLLKKGVRPESIFYFTLDDFSLRQELSASFDNFLRIVEGILGDDLQHYRGLLYIFIDEIQKLPDFVEYIKTLYDLRWPIKWILTGSSSLELKKHIKESLAGRVLSMSVLPFTETEILKGHGFVPPDKREMWDFILGKKEIDKKTLRKYYAMLMPHKQRIQKVFDESMLFGGLPAVALSKEPEKKQLLLKNYIDTYLEQDIRTLVKEDKLWVYHKVMELLAARIGDILNYSKIATQLEVTVDTVKRYSILLEKTFVIQGITTCSRNVRNEVLKTPKVYFTDLGIRNALIGLNSISQLERLNQYGMVFENAIVGRLSTIMPYAAYGTRLHYWRTKTKEEVDIVVYTPERLLPIEVKADKKVQTRHLKGLKRFFQKEGETTGILIGRFEDVEILQEDKTKIYVIPYWMI